MGKVIYKLLISLNETVKIDKSSETFQKTVVTFVVQNLVIKYILLCTFLFESLQYCYFSSDID